MVSAGNVLAIFWGLWVSWLLEDVLSTSRFVCGLLPASHPPTCVVCFVVCIAFLLSYSEIVDLQGDVG